MLRALGPDWRRRNHWAPDCRGGSLGISGSSTACFPARPRRRFRRLHAYLAEWPRDALVVAAAGNPNGLIGSSGRLGQKHQIAVMMDGLAPHYGDDWWFLAYHAMALSEDGQLAAARPKIERSVALEPNNAHGAHGFAHVCYESGEGETARAYLSSWLATYPRDGFFYGHLSWHQSLCELQAGNWQTASRLYRDAIALDRHSGGPQQKMSDGAAYLWRSELAGQPRDVAAWQAMAEYADAALPRPGSGLADLHVVLAQAVAGEDGARAVEIDAAARDGRYLSGSYLPEVARGFAAFECGDFAAAVAALAPLAGQNERIGGSRAQHDLIEFTLLRGVAQCRPVGGSAGDASSAPARGVGRSGRRSSCAPLKRSRHKHHVSVGDLQCLGPFVLCHPSGRNPMIRSNRS